MADPRIVLLAGEGASTRAVHQALLSRFGPVRVILERPVSPLQLLRRRVRRLGLPTVAGQILFMSAVVPVLKVSGRKRIEEICRQYGLDLCPLPKSVTHVLSANSDETRQALRDARPDVVVVNGTRILSPETLRAVDAPFVNTHAGITPMFRGVHGGYWALAHRRPELAGTTVHLVDEGVDTGAILAQAAIRPSEEDSFATYPYLQLGVGLPLLLDAVAKLLRGSVTPLPPRNELPSALRSHPTAWGYIARRVLAGVR